MEKIKSALLKHRNLVLEAERYIWKNPETGYKEFKTDAYMKENFRSLGYELCEAEGITGFTATLDTGRAGPTLLILGELDSVICPSHPEADRLTGAVHSCGHNAQCAALLGIAAALKEPGVTDGLSGRIMLCAVPAEELLEIEFREGLRAEGKIKYLGGKSEFLSRGMFDGVDLAFMVHTSTAFCSTLGSVGCVAKRIIYKGVASHAGGSPWNGRNALYAATCGINAVNAIRETFMDSDIIRVHPIITDGGSMVNAIPERATLESYVRGKTFKAIREANEKVDRALIGAALSLGNNIEIVDTPGYAPLRNAEGMIDVAADAAALALPELHYERQERYASGSTDMGDLSMLMPVIHPYMSGAVGKSHGSDYKIADPETACICSALWQLAMLRLLLENGASRAKKIVNEFTPEFASTKEFLDYQDSVSRFGDRIRYTDEGAIISL